MVNIFAQFAQATSDAGQRRVNPIRTMETLVDRIMRYRPKNPPPRDNLVVAPANIQPEVQILENPAGLQPAAAPGIQPRQAVNPLYVDQQAATVPPRGGGGRGGPGGGELREVLVIMVSR